MEKADLYNHKKRYQAWKKEAKKSGYKEEGLSLDNSKMLLKYVFDMELGLNISNKNKKGARGFHRLNAIRQKVKQILKMLEERGIKDIRKISKKELVLFFNDMSNGVIKTQKGEKYKSTADYVKSFKAFWRWYMKASRGNIQDITEELDTKQDEKPKWVYLGNKEIEKVIQNIKTLYKPVISFLYDSGARVTETFSLVVGDVTKEGSSVFVNIRNEISKGGNCGRKIKLMLSGEDILKYIKENKLKQEDKLFYQSPFMVNKELKKISKKLFGDDYTQAGDKYSNLTMYDFRHNSCCFWLPRYKTAAALMYRFGWKSEKYIHYYSELLGMKDTISQEDMFIDISKTELEKKVKKSEKVSKDLAEGFSSLLKVFLDKKIKLSPGDYERLQEAANKISNVNIQVKR